MIKDNFNRKILNEGRDYGFGFSFLNKNNIIITGDSIQDISYETLMPFTACKDYLNDFVYIETTKKPLSKIYGFEHKYTGVFEGKEYFYLGIKALNYNHGNFDWPGKSDLQNNINNNSKNLILFLNKLEEFFKLDTITEFENLIEDTLILKVPIFWSSFNFLISLYTLYIRCFINISEEELKKDLKELIERQPYLKEDLMLLKSSCRWMEFDKLLEYKYPDNVDAHNIHNSGISARINTFIMEENKQKLAKAI